MRQFLHHSLGLLASLRFNIGAALLASVLFFFSYPAIAADLKNNCTQGNETEPPLCPLQLPTIKDISITTNAMTVWKDKDASDCQQFGLGKQQVMKYFAKAKAADLQAIHFTLAESPCRASGRISFSDGSTGTWTIDQLQVGILIRDGHIDQGLYCKDCNFSPFIRQ